MVVAGRTNTIRLWIQEHCNILFNILAGLLWVGITIYLVFGFWGVTYDDVFLAFQYASHLESGLGFVFNAGEHFLGTPAPLYVLLLAGTHQLLPWFTLPQIGSILSGTGLSLAGWIAFQLGRRWNQPWTGLLCGLLVVTSPYTVMTLGGETPIYLAMTMAAIYYYCIDKPSISATLLALAMVNRSEAVIPIGILLVLYMYEKRHFPFAMIIPLAIVLLPWFAYSFIVFGGPVSNSFTAKIAQVAAGLQRYPIGLRHWTGNFIRNSHSLFLILIPTAGLGFLTLPFTAKHWRILVAWTVAQTIAYALLPIPFYHWYAAQLGVLSAVLVSLGTVQIVEWIRHPDRLRFSWLKRLSIRKPMATTPLKIGLCILSFACLACAGVAFLAQVELTRNYQVTTPNPSNKIYTKTGIWLAENTPKDARIAYLEIGQIAFYSHRYVVDLLGLVTPGISQRVGQDNWVWAFLKYKPDYIIYNGLFANWMDNLYAEDWFIKGFEKVAVIEEPGYGYPLEIYHKKPGTVIPDPVDIDLDITGGMDSTGPMFNGYSVKQTFIAQHDQLTALEIRIGTYTRNNKGTLDVSVAGEDGRQLASWQVDGAEILDNRWRRFYMPPMANSSGKKFTLEVHFDGPNEQNAVTIWTNAQPNRYLQGELVVNGQKSPGALDLRTYYSSPLTK